MAKGKLKSSERNVAKIFEACGFEVKINTEVEGIIIELLAKKDLPDVQKAFKVACVFRYENSEEDVRELILRCKANKERINVSKIILIVFGIEILGEDRQMAEENDILIWEEDDLKDNLGCIKRKDGINKIMGELGLLSYIDPDTKKQIPDDSRY